VDRDLIAAAADPVFARQMASDPLPGCVYGVLLGGRLVHWESWGLAALGGERRPDPDTVFRIASMTKSFTAAATLSLRDDGGLRLDDPVSSHVPELAGATADPRVTLRHLLTMTAGYTTDDPWGDRQQDLDPRAFLRFLRSGPSVGWRPGEAYEYSNLGYAVLGVVLERVTGQPYRQVVEERVLAPLGLGSTGFVPDAVPESSRAVGYVRRADTWVPEPYAAYGAFAPMGGLLSTVRDLVAWVATFLAAEDGDAVPGRVAAASLREMQRSARLVDADLGYPEPDGEPELRVRGYGFGLVEEFLPEGRTVGHSGGYPGFGSHMRWHPESGLGIVALGNRTYAPMTRVATEALRAILRAGAPQTRRRATPQVPRSEAARDAVERLLVSWDDTVAAEWFADNMAADEPLELRRARFEQVRDQHGPLRREQSVRPAWGVSGEPISPAQCSWWLADEQGGRVRVDLLLSPHPDPLIQWLVVTSVPAPDPALEQAAAAEVRNRAADPRWSGARLGAPVGGDGATRAVFSVEGAAREAEVTAQRPAPADPVAVTWRALPVRADIR
jgi:CubicO group peptidase (beta-lactamase class C family)